MIILESLRHIIVGTICLYLFSYRTWQVLTPMCHVFKHGLFSCIYLFSDMCLSMVWDGLPPLSERKSLSSLPAPRLRLVWCQSKIQSIWALFLRSAGYLKPKCNIVKTPCLSCCINWQTRMLTSDLSHWEMHMTGTSRLHDYMSNKNQGHSLDRNNC